MENNVPEYLRKSKAEIEQIKEKELKELHNYNSPLNCPCCNKRMIYIKTLFDFRKRNRSYYRKYRIPDDWMF